MIELRWAPNLQFRTLVAVDASGAFCPGPPGKWQDVPEGPVAGPLSASAVVNLWHQATDAHKSDDAFEWFAAGVIAAEKHHGIGGGLD